ncbi:unnamed protein product, partial [marine sediment metagenome]
MGAFRDFFTTVLDTLVTKPLIAVVDAIKSIGDKARDWNYITAIEWSKTVAAVEEKWEAFPAFAKEDPEVKAAY